MEVAPFFVDFHQFWLIFTIFYRVSLFTHFCHDLHFVAIYALFPQFFCGQNSLLRNITRFLHVWLDAVLILYIQIVFMFLYCIFVIWCERPAYLLGRRWLKVCIKLNVPWQMVETAVKPSQRLNFHGFESYSNMRDLDLQLLTLMKVLIMMLMPRMDA